MHKIARETDTSTMTYLTSLQYVLPGQACTPALLVEQQSHNCLASPGCSAHAQRGVSVVSAQPQEAGETCAGRVK